MKKFLFYFLMIIPASYSMDTRDTSVAIAFFYESNDNKKIKIAQILYNKRIHITIDDNNLHYSFYKNPKDLEENPNGEITLKTPQGVITHSPDNKFITFKNEQYNFINSCNTFYEKPKKNNVEINYYTVHSYEADNDKKIVMFLDKATKNWNIVVDEYSSYYQVISDKAFQLPNNDIQIKIPQGIITQKADKSSINFNEQTYKNTLNTLYTKAYSCFYPIDCSRP